MTSDSTMDTPRRVDVASVVGARPQFVKCAGVSRALRAAGLSELLIHTGQHYDDAMSGVFFRELDIPAPDLNLGVGSGSHARQTGVALTLLEEVFLEHHPRMVLVYGDTNSTLAGALAAVKLGIPVAHVEAGLRSYNQSMPEEINRVATDHWSAVLLCHNEAAEARLRSERVLGRIRIVGDVMREMVTNFAPCALSRTVCPETASLQRGGYAVLTVHRPVNADALALREILNWCGEASLPLVFPAHPRVRDLVAGLVRELGLRRDAIHLLPPLGYLDMLALTAGAAVVLTDSGGLQKEAFFLRVPCVTLRSETEWGETVEAGWNVLAGDRPTPEQIDRAVRAAWDVSGRVGVADHEAVLDAAFGPRDPSRRIAEALVEYLIGPAGT